MPTVSGVRVEIGPNREPLGQFDRLVFDLLPINEVMASLGGWIDVRVEWKFKRPVSLLIDPKDKDRAAEILSWGQCSLLPIVAP